MNNWVGSRVIKALAVATPSTPPQATNNVSPGALYCCCLCILVNEAVLRASDKRMDITGGSSSTEQILPVVPTNSTPPDGQLTNRLCFLDKNKRGGTQPIHALSSSSTPPPPYLSRLSLLAWSCKTAIWGPGVLAWHVQRDMRHRLKSENSPLSDCWTHDSLLGVRRHIGLLERPVIRAEHFRSSFQESMTKQQIMSSIVLSRLSRLSRACRCAPRVGRVVVLCVRTEIEAPCV